MSQSFVTDAGTLYIPGAYPEVKVVTSNSQLATSGVIMIIGEADAGPDFSAETDLGRNMFGPDQQADFVAKYKSGNLVDAFVCAITPSSDDLVSGSFSAVIPLKTNISGRASGPLLKWDTSNYGTLQDRSFGKLGNLISTKISAKTSESVPSTGPFALMLPINATEFDFRVNGGSLQSHETGSLDTPTAMVSAINGLTGVKALGGANLGIIGGVTGQLTLTVVSGNNVTLHYSANFSGTAPKLGDTLYISSASVLAASNANAAGSYLITGASANTISATKLRDVTGSHNSLTPPTSKGPINVASTTADAEAFGQVTIQLLDLANDSVTPIDGTGKSLEISCPNTANLADIAFNFDGTPVAFFSTSSTPKIIVSASEYVADVTESRQADNITNDVTAGGKVALAVGYQGTTAHVVNDGTSLTFTVTGGAGSAPAPIALKDFKTINDLAGYITTLTGFTAGAGTAVMGSQPPTSLDMGTFTCASTFGGTPGRIKQDAYAFYVAMRDNGALTMETTEAASGLPAPTTGFSFLTGGSLGATSDATFQAALNKLKLVRGNFVVPLFSRDATADVADGLTDPSSSYTIAAIHQNTRSHVLSMSTLKARRNRQAFLSIRDTFDNCQTVAANLANSRCSCSFEDVMDTGASGSLTQFQPWMAAVKAASFQSAAFYQAIFNKDINISGAVQAAADFSDQDDDAVTTALQSGLLPIRRDENGGWHWVSDQTTYGADNNFVYNSIQAVYASDLVALTTASRMEKAFVGRSIADISASMATATLEGIMADMLRLKLIAPSDDAPKGFKNAKVKIQGPAMIVSVEIKLAGAIYFIPITFQVTQVVQSA
jgi:hypothetical protein